MLLDTNMHHPKRQSYTILEKYLLLLFSTFRLYNFEIEPIMNEFSQ
ncbi:hypothetical protein KC711_06310 [Candidatus Peregrinibacteria bacterium]|nr:hypothetical protein [Candidatus Peregrinibacteria bacterium]